MPSIRNMETPVLTTRPLIVALLKNLPRTLKMEDVSFTPELLAKQPFDNAVEEDDCHIQQTTRVEGKARDENRDDEELKNKSKKPLFEMLGSDEGKEGSDVEIAILKGVLD